MEEPVAKYPVPIKPTVGQKSKITLLKNKKNPWSKCIICLIGTSEYSPYDMWSVVDATITVELFEALNDEYQSFKQKLSSTHSLIVQQWF